MSARLALRCLDVVLPTFLVPYLVGIWLLWGDGRLASGACAVPELTALGRWLCLGWLPCLVAALAATGWSSAWGRLAPLPAALKTAIPVLFLASVPFWLYAIHVAVRGLGAELPCESPLRCSFSRPEPSTELGHALERTARDQREVAPETGEASDPAAAVTPAHGVAPSAGADAVPDSAGIAERSAQPPTTEPIAPIESAQISARTGSGGGNAGRESGAPSGGGSLPEALESLPAASPPASSTGPPEPSTGVVGPAAPGPAGSGRPDPASPSRDEALVDGTAFHPNGRIRCSGAYRSFRGERVKTGTWTTWSASGQKLSEGRYTEGRREGPWREWHENGQPKRNATYRDGRPQADLAEWHADGTVALRRNELRTDDGRVLWVEERFHPGGPRAARHQYENGVREGPAREWDEAGRPLAAGGYASGEKDGLWILWDASGNGRHQRYEAGAARGPAQP